MTKLRRWIVLAVVVLVAAACYSRTQVGGMAARAYSNPMICTYPPGAGPGSALGYVGPGNKKVEIPGTGNLVKFKRAPNQAVAVTLREVQRPDNMIVLELETTLDLQQYPAEIFVSYNDKRCNEELDRDDRNIYVLNSLTDTQGVPLASEQVFYKQSRLKATIDHNSYYIIAD